MLLSSHGWHNFPWKIQLQRRSGLNRGPFKGDRCSHNLKAAAITIWAEDEGVYSTKGANKWIGLTRGRQLGDERGATIITAECHMSFSFDCYLAGNQAQVNLLLPRADLSRGGAGDREA